MAEHRILVVDDHPDAAEIACVLLRALGYVARPALDGQSGVALLDQLDPDIAILDIGLPDISGYELAAELRARFGDKIYLAAMTGWGQRDDRERAKAAGFDLHVLKPTDLTGLRKVVEAAESKQRITALGRRE